MKVYTYFTPVPELNLDDEMLLLTVWQDNWRANGFEPIVLSERDAASSKAYEPYCNYIAQFPTLNPRAYERACFLRWLAMVQVGGGIMTDADVMCYGWKPPVTDGRLACFQKFVPCVMTGCAEAFLAAIYEFSAYQPSMEDDCKESPDKKTLHVSDMTIIASSVMDSRIHRFDVAKEYMEPGWETAPLVHYSHSKMAKYNKLPKWRNIPITR